jgi:hypothetical protein
MRIEDTRTNIHQTGILPMQNPPSNHALPLPPSHEDGGWPGGIPPESLSDLETAWRGAVGHLPQQGCEVEKARVYEDLKLQQEHAGKYVAYIDHLESTSDNKPQLWREVICSDETVDVVQKAAAAHPSSALVLIDYIDLGESEPLMLDRHFAEF